MTFINAPDLLAEFTARARGLGFVAVGVARPKSLDQDAVALKRWLGAGRHAEMGWMARDPGRRTDPARILPDAKSIIVLAFPYYAGDHPPIRPQDKWGKISRYAWGRDYHRVIEKRLADLERWLRGRVWPGVRLKSYVDYGPILEKAFAREAGLGFIGKNTLLITERHGSWVFLSVILTSLELPSGISQTSQCGSCRACLDACPTGALTAPYELDARRCISYLTIEHEAEPAEDLKPKMEDWVFGCDICQEVCPYNAQAEARTEAASGDPRNPGPYLDLEAAQSLDETSFRQKFSGTPLMRAGWEGMVRNARIALQNRSEVRHG
jgi:epoxyqueuosine reductase